MGNLEKAGVLVVVALLAVILVVAFMNHPEENKTTLSAGADPLKVETPRTLKGGPTGDSLGAHKEPEVKPAPGKPDASGQDAGKTSGGTLRPDNAKPSNSGNTGRSPDETPPASKPPAGNGAKQPAVENGAKPDPTSTAGWPKHVKVAAGESIAAIAKREYGSRVGVNMVKKVLEANPTVKPESMKIGTELTLPAPPEPTTPKLGEKSGDTTKPGTKPAADPKKDSPTSRKADAKPKKKLNPWDPDPQ